MDYDFSRYRNRNIQTIELLEARRIQFAGIHVQCYNYLDNLAICGGIQMVWKLAEAKNRFTELVNKALLEGPQKVTRRDDTVVVISEDEYKNLTGGKRNFIDFLLDGQLDLNKVDFKRDKSLSRKVNL
jgi:prevent-host-death family protein